MTRNTKGKRDYRPQYLFNLLTRHIRMSCLDALEHLLSRILGYERDMVRGVVISRCTFDAKRHFKKLIDPWNYVSTSWNGQ